MKLSHFLTLFFGVFCVSGCGTSGRYVSTSDDLKSGRYETYALDGLQVWKTFGSSKPISAAQGQMIEQIATALHSKGYLRATNKAPDLKISLRITATENVIMSDEQLRFNKGTRGGNFVNANPRMRSYQSDSLVLEALPRIPNDAKGASDYSKDPAFFGSCLVASAPQPARMKVGNTTHKDIPITDAMRCLDYLLMKFPKRSAR